MPLPHQPKQEIDMDMGSVNEMTSLIKKQVESHEKMQGYLLKAEALAHVALSEDFLDYSKPIVSEYLVTLRDIIIQSKSFNDYLLRNLMFVHIVAKKHDKLRD